MEEERIAIIGGTGPQGRGLAYRLARAGRRVVIGSRDAARAEQGARTVNERLPGAESVTWAENREAAAGSQVVILAVPYRGHAELVRSLAGCLAGKVIVSCCNPLGFDRRGPFGLDVPDGSAAEELQLLVPAARVVGAFHHLSAVTLWSAKEDLADEDVLMVGDDEHALDVAGELCAAVTGKPGVVAGPLRLARQLEPLTATLISVNKRYRTQAGVRLVGVNLPEIDQDVDIA
ncbi:NADPH-dependent F420 reductase [Amycolatopsis sp. NPDC049253]|uniref:NADPH-dependent F420 reductase n=1 Tax=Amycolatopsis sp. NPDC049253 TaxID=3155274 RepID=UPI003419E4A3